MATLKCLFTTVDDRIELMPFFLDYYARLGVRLFVIGLWNGTDNPIHDKLMAGLAKWMPNGCKAEVECSLRCDYSGYCGVNETPWLNQGRLRIVQDNEWYAVADLDEFYYFGGRTMPEVIEEAESRSCLAVTGAEGEAFVDRVAEAGFPPVPEYGKGTLDETFPLATDLTRACGCGTSKVALARQDVTILSGHHHTIRGVPKLVNSVDVHHFKWNSNVIRLLHKRHLAYHSQKLPHAPESSRFIELFLNDSNWRSRPDINARPAQKLGI